jgi:hypothetical protein
MFAVVKKQLLARRMRQLISLALGAIYSEQSDLSAVVTSLSGGKDGIDLLRAYISIRIAMRLIEPLTDADVADATEQLLAAESHLNTPNFDAILDLHKELAELHWLRKHAAILKGKLAHKNDEYSYEGTIYALQRDRKEPVTVEEREKAKEICGKMADLSRQIEEHELKAWKQSDLEEYQRMKEELEIRTLQDEVDSHEDANADTEVEELTARLEQKLKRVFHRDAAGPDQTLEPDALVSESAGNQEHYQAIVSSFADLIADDSRLIGDSSLLPYPKKTILYAIAWVRAEVEDKSEATADESVREKCRNLINTLNFLLTRLADDWHAIAPEDKAAVAKLKGLDSLPDWALPLKARYLNSEMAAEEACEATLQVLEDRTHREGRRA